MSKLVDTLAQKIDYLRYREIEGVLAVLLEKPGISSNELIQTTGLPKQTLSDFKGDASFLLAPAKNDSIYIREEYLAELNADQIRSYAWKPHYFENQTLISQLVQIRKDHKLETVRELDQFFATEQTSIAKAQILDKKGLLDNTEIALLGEDDLVSTSILLSTKNSQKITVFEVDKNLTATLKAINDGLGAKNVQYISYDARNELPNIHKNRYDVVVTDPPYTKAGLTLFLNRAIDMLKKDKFGNYIYLYFGNSYKTPEKASKLQEIIGQMGLVIEEKLPKFATYTGAESIGSTSDLYILKTTPFTHTLAQVSDFSDLYTFQKANEEKFPYVDHVVAKLFNVPAAVVGSKSALQKALGEFCKMHKLKVVDEKITKFGGKSDGLTITFILANSNLVVHTWPEFGAIHIDLVTCSPIFIKNKLAESLALVFGTKRVEVRVVE